MNISLKERMKKENYKLVSIDLFAGPGGLCTGFEWGGILPLIAVEWTDTTVETYSSSHDAEIFVLNQYKTENGLNKEYLQSFMKESTKTIMIHGDINQVDSELIKAFLLNRYGINSINETVDVVSGGAPCESFSMAGTRTAGDKRDNLFSNIVRISRDTSTKTILFENVKGMFSKSKNGVKGAIFEHICDVFDDKNATPSYKLVSRNPDEILLKASDYGVPQSRERLFLVAIRRDLLDSVIFQYPEKEYGPGRKYPYVTVEDAISDLPLVASGEEITHYQNINKFKSHNQKRFVHIMRANYQDNILHSFIPQHLKEKGLFDKNTLSYHKGPGHLKRKLELLALIPEGESMKSTFKNLTEKGSIHKVRHLFPKTIYGSRNRRLIWNEPSFTVTSHCLDEMLHPVQNRAISPREAARLQSFPDWYQFAGPYVAFHSSKEQDKYEQIGDAIPPLLAFALAKQFVKALTKD